MDQILSQRRKIAEEVTVDSASADINLDKIERAKLSQLVASVKRKNELNSKGKGKRQRSAK